MSACVEYVVDRQRIYTTGEEQFISFGHSFSHIQFKTLDEVMQCVTRMRGNTDTSFAAYSVSWFGVKPGIRG